MNDGDVDSSIVCEIEGDSLGRGVKSIVGEKVGLGGFGCSLNGLDVFDALGMLGVGI